jgi:hypothetical protein
MVTVKAAWRTRVSPSRMGVARHVKAISVTTLALKGWHPLTKCEAMEREMAKKAKEFVPSNIVDIGEAMEKRATELASLIDTHVSGVIHDLAEHKREYQGGPFVVMNNVLTWLTEKDYDLDSLPDPKSDAGNNPANYKIKVDGKNGVRYKDVYFYDEIANKLPSILVIDDRIDLLNRSMAKDKSKVKTDDIPSDVLQTPIYNRMAEVRRLSQQKTVARANVSTAFELYHQLKKFGELDTVSVEIVYALDNSGKPCDGEEGRPFKVEKINSPIIVRSTVKGRQDEDKGQYSVASFLKFDVAKAMEAPGGATFHSLEQTLAKGTTTTTPTAQVAVNTLQTFVTRLNDESDYLHRIIEATDKAGWEALKRLANADTEEGKLFLYNLSYLVHNLRPIADDPRNQVKFQAMVNERDNKAA